MKKLVCIIAALVLVFAFTSCTNTGTCESCGDENVKLKTFTYANESYDVCESCYKLLKLFSSFNLGYAAQQ